jgi:hypothetical protein
MRRFMAYSEEQFTSMMGVLNSFGARISALELKVASSVPLASVYHQRKDSTGGPSSPPRAHTRSGVGVPKARGHRLMVDREKVAHFACLNPSYPSLRAIRTAKIKVLCETMGLPTTPLEWKASDWTEEGIYTRLVTEHEAEA